MKHKRIGIGSNRINVEELGKRIFQAADELGCNAADIAETCNSIIGFLVDQDMVICIPLTENEDRRN